MVSSVPLSETIRAGRPRTATIASSSHTTRRLGSSVPTAASPSGTIPTYRYDSHCCQSVTQRPSGRRNRYGSTTVGRFCQRSGREVRLIDYYEASGVGLDHYARALGGRPYVYGEHLLPHDAEVRELGTGKSRVETLASLGIRPRVLPAMRVEDGINAARNLLPQCWFDAARCAGGLEALRQYRREWDERLRAFRPRPLHDWTSHAADAFRYLAQGLRADDPGWARSLTYSNRGIV